MDLILIFYVQNKRFERNSLTKAAYEIFAKYPKVKALLL